MEQMIWLKGRVTDEVDIFFPMVDGVYQRQGVGDGLEDERMALAYGAGDGIGDKDEDEVMIMC